MEKTIGKEYKNARDREAFLKDNCDKVEEKGYMKPYTPEELQGHKENLANVSIEIAEVEAGKKFTEYECALMFQKFKKEFGYSQVEIADKFKKSPAFISKCLSLLDLPKEIQDKIINGDISVKAAMFRHLLEYEKGNTIDEETGCKHLAQVVWNAIAMLHVSKNK